MSLQEALKLMRLELGMTQMDLAQKLNKAFITVNRWENGKGFPSRENAKSILDIARDGRVSKDCYTYLNEMLMPDLKRGKSAAVYGFPDIDRDFLFQLADGSTNCLYVIEARTYQLLYANRQAEKFAVKYLTAKGEPVQERRLTEQSDRRCFHYFGNRETPCSFCPLGSLDFAEYKDAVITIPESGRTMHIHAKATKTNGRDVYAIYLTDITEKNAERNALYELTNDIPDSVGIYHVYYDNRIELVFMNQAFFKMIGSEKKEELLQNGQTDLSLIHAEDRERLREEIRHSVAHKRNVNLTMRMRVIDGTFHAIHLHGRLIKKATEKLTFYCLFREMERQ